jgi:V/A-type H+-transporting ATPase subunit E
MDLDKVIQDIIDRGEKEATAIRNEAIKKKEEIMADAKKGVAETINNKEKAANAIVQRTRNQEILNAELEGKKLALVAQKELLEEVRNETLKRISKLPQETNIKLLTALLSKTPPEFKGGYIYYNKKDSETIRKLSKNFEFGGNIECAGGFVVENKERTVREDYRFETILDEVWEKSLKDVAELLFKSGDTVYLYDGGGVKDEG